MNNNSIILFLLINMSYFDFKINHDISHKLLKQTYNSISDNIRRIGDLEVLKCNESKVDTEFAEVKELQAEFQKVADKSLISCKSIERFIDLYLPVKVQQQISETM